MRVIYWLLLAICLAATFLVIGLPSLASTSWGNQKILELFNSQMGATARVQSIKVTWFGPQRIEHLAVKNEDEQNFLTISEIEINKSLFDLLLNRIPGNLSIKNLNAIISRTIGERLVVKQANGNVHFEVGQPVVLNLKGATEEGVLAGNFDIEAEIDEESLKKILSQEMTLQELHEDPETKLKMKATVSNFPVALLEELYAFAGKENTGALRQWLGNQVNFQLNHLPTTEGLDISLQATSPQGIFNGVFKINNQGLQLAKPVGFTLVVTPEMAKSTFPSIKLQSPTQVEVEIDSLFLPLDSIYNKGALTLDFEALSGSARFHFPELEIFGGQDVGTVALKDIFGTFDAKDRSTIADISIGGQAFHKGKPIKFNVGGTINKPRSVRELFHQIIPGMKLEGKIQGVPLSAFNGAIDIPLFFLQIEENATWEHLVGSLAIPSFALPDKSVSLTNLQTKWKIVPAKSKILVDFQGVSAFHQNEIGQFSGHLDFKKGNDLRTASIETTTNLSQFPVAFLNMAFPSRNLSFLGEAIDLKLEGKLNFADLSSGKADLYLFSQNVTGKATLNAERLTFNAHLNEPSGGHLDVTGVVEKIFAANGGINSEDASMEISGIGSGLSMETVAEVATISQSKKEQLEAIFGNTLDVDLQMHLEKMGGPVYAQIKGENGFLHFKGQCENNTLYLTDPFVVETASNPTLGRLIFEPYLPLFSSMVQANQNIKLVVDPKGFSVRINPFNLETVLISHATLEFGEVQFVNQGSLASALSYFVPASIDQVRVWFMPIYFSLINGELKLERTDLLVANQFPLAVWGTVNIPQDKVKMVVALSGLAVSKAFNISVPSAGDFVQLPLKGTLRSSSIDKSKATSKITALAAQSQGGPHGVVLGTVLEIAGGKYKDEKLPNPTTSPLPWEYMLQTSEDRRTASSSRNVAEKVNPLKELERGADSLIKHILR